MSVDRNVKHTASSWMFDVFVLAVCLIFLSDNNFHQGGSMFVAARPVTSFQLATGEWDVSIRGASWMDPSFLFPSVYTSHSVATQNSNDEPKIGKTVPVVKRKRWGSSLDCKLSLASDGTFVLTPKQVTTTVAQDVDNSRDTTTGVTPTIPERFANMFRKYNTQTRTPEPGVLDLRGSWKVLANPYCVTDRFYDQVSITADPRQRVFRPERRETSEGSGTTTFDDGTEDRVLRTVQWTMNCRVWGRHTGTGHRQLPGRRGINPYRMTHGTLAVRDLCTEGDDSPWWRRFCRPVVASFTAVRSSDQPNHQGWVDQNRYGY
mmetsp:Transcript_8615/g.21199  ORF Transcript_8615/g.21199 Transcript_8615/m.21199 type:complete len:319 (+) Transcript_8615:152-1108(+)